MLDAAQAEAAINRAWAGWSEALDGHPFVHVADLFGEIARGEARWWRSDNADVFARIDKGVLEIGPVAGDVDEMLRKLLEPIEAWGRDNGAFQVHIQAGREGWSRVLKHRGYETAAVILRKAL